MNQGHIKDELLVKYLLGEASAEERNLTEQWVNANAENKRYFDHFKLIWDNSKKLAVDSKMDENEAWERFKQRIDNPATITKTIALPHRSFTWARAAAILVLVAVGGLIAYMANHKSPQYISLRSGNETLVDTLPDGSVVTLNKASTLTYAASPGSATRDVTLTGEAFFDVAHDKSKPFVISVNDVTVQVVGTSFNVKSTDDRTEVVVETGIVSVKKKENEIKVNPHEMATVLKNGDVPTKENSKDELYNYYRTKEFICNSTPLWRLVDVLNEAYGVNIVIGNERLRNFPLTTTFRNEPLENILAVVSETLNVRVERKGIDIILK